MTLPLSPFSFHPDQFRSCQPAAASHPRCSHLIPHWAPCQPRWTWVTKSDPNECYHRRCESSLLSGFACPSELRVSLPWLSAWLLSEPSATKLFREHHLQTRLCEEPLRWPGQGSARSGHAAYPQRLTSQLERTVCTKDELAGSLSGTRCSHALCPQGCPCPATLPGFMVPRAKSEIRYEKMKSVFLGSSDSWAA